MYWMNKEALKEHIAKKVHFSNEEIEVFLSYFKEKKVKKKQFIILRYKWALLSLGSLTFSKMKKAGKSI
jgi:hypothetical protein